MNERRELPRWEINMEAKVWLPLKQEFSHCIIEDMHLKGMCVSFTKRQASQTLVKMSLAIGHSFDMVKVETDVRWSKEDQGRHLYGMAFNRIADQDKEKIYQYINTNCYDQFKNKWWA